MKSFLREHCLAPRTLWFKLMTCKHHAPYLNMWTIALYVCNNPSVPMLQESADIITDGDNIETIQKRCLRTIFLECS